MPNEPLVKMEPGGKASIVAYDVPESTAYSGRNFIELGLPPSAFVAPATRDTPARTPVKGRPAAEVHDLVTRALRDGLIDRDLFPNARSVPAALLEALDPGEVAAQLQAGRRLNVYRSMYGTPVVKYLPEPRVRRPRLMLVEAYQLTSFPGRFGAGRIVKGFTLMPGEKTKISIKTYSRRQTDEKSASSVLDSFTEESSSDFENSLQTEQSDKASYTESFEYHADAEASASWGWGDAAVAGGVKGGTNTAREEFAKNVSSALQKHASKASAKREVQVNTSYEAHEEAGEETSIEREVANISLSRVLNLVFRQMNQEFVSLLHLVDVRVAYFDGFAESVLEVPLSRLDSLLAKVVVASERAAVRAMVVQQLQAVLDHADEPVSVVEEKVLGEDSWFRFKRGLVSRWTDPVSGVQYQVPGVVLAATPSVLRTDAVIAEAMLGEGEALDGYAKRLQELEIRRRSVEVDQQTAAARRAELMNQFAEAGRVRELELLTTASCPCRPTPPAEG